MFAIGRFIPHSFVHGCLPSGTQRRTVFARAVNSVACEDAWSGSLPCRTSSRKSRSLNLWLGLAILWWLVNLLEDSNDDTDDAHMATDASRCLWALCYGCRPDVISLCCIHLPVPLNCAWGVSSDAPYNASDVVNLLKTSVRKGDTEEDVVMHLASRGQPLFQQHQSPAQASDADSSEAEIEAVTDPQTPKPKGKTEKQRQKEKEMSVSYGSKRRCKSSNTKSRRRRRRTRPKRRSKQIARGKKKRINWQRQPVGHPYHKKRAANGLWATL